MTRRDMRRGCMGLPLRLRTARKPPAPCCPFIANARTPARPPAAHLLYGCLNANGVAVIVFSLTQACAPKPLQ
ncbi:hypothetical protein AB7M38_001867 [Bradyrhizobium diazoefficiens]